MKKFYTGALLIAVLLLHVPAHGQTMHQVAPEVHAGAANKASFGVISTSRLDLPAEIAEEAPASRGFSTVELASTLIEILASQNTITLDDFPSGRMDAYLRPPQEDSGGESLFRTAKSVYDNATSIESNRTEVNIDPLKMRCVVRIVF